MSIFSAGKTALITGGASGVGLAVAKLCQRSGMNVAIVDNNTTHLSLASKALAQSSSETQTKTFELDVSQPSQWALLKSSISQAFPQGIDLLMLNAGVGPKGTWGDAEYFHKIMDVNLYGVINGLNTFVPVLQNQQTADKSRKQCIVITGSKQGITNPPGNAAYNASKAAVKTLAEHLSFDMKDTNTAVHLLVPGWTFTALTSGGPTDGKQKPDGAWAPEQVAAFLEEKVNAGQFWAICPDNDVTESMDRKRMLWTAGDAVYGRLPCSRWRGEYAEESKKWMDAQDL